MFTSNPVRVIAASLTFAIAASLEAQSFVIRGQVESGQAVGCYYCPSATQFVIKGSETPIRSNSISLGTFLAQDVLITATWNGSHIAPILDVTSIQVTNQTFTISGNSSMGNTVRFTASGAAGDLAVNIASLGGSFTPIGGSAALLLDPNSAVVLGIGAVGGAGTFRTDLLIPTIPSLFGMHLFGQALIVPASGLFYMTNPDVKRVQ
jgi:hypothetical protein